MDLLRMEWRDALFAHWAVDPDVVSPRLPDALEVATYDGDAWLGVVGFVMADIRPRGAPIGLSFPELNLRTYVTRGDADSSDHSVYFFSLDADDRIGVFIARRLFQLPYFRAEMGVDREDEAVTLRSRRVHSDVAAARFDATYRPVDDPSAPTEGSLEHFLTENYRFYTAGDRLYYGDIDHPPWPIAEATAEFRTNTLFAANGFDSPAGDPIVHYSPGTDVAAGRIHRV